MLFNSLGFLLFFPTVCIVYWLLPGRGVARSFFLLVASYWFYMSWQPVYGLLIALVTIAAWGVALCMGDAADSDAVGVKRQRGRRLWLAGGLIAVLSVLFVYKYLDFFGHEIARVMHMAGVAVDVPDFGLLLPVGISFYTFQATGYLVDVYRGDMRPERSLLHFALFVSFFPQLVAGPIEQARNLLPQLHARHTFSGDAVRSGLNLMLWGYFMKLCVADNLSPYVDAVFGHTEYHGGWSFMLATVFYTFQILCDFGGYSLIAIGAARCMGFRLTSNFRQPYLAVSIKDFWRRWHVSLSGWFTHYLYIPLGGNRCGAMRHALNVMTVFLVSGLWHGAAWTFVLWGGAHGLMMVIHSRWQRLGRHPGAGMPRWLTLPLSTAFTFSFVALAWVLFRAQSLGDAAEIYSGIFSCFTGHGGTLYKGDGMKMLMLCVAMICILAIRELRLRMAGSDEEYPEHPVREGLRGGLLLVCILMFGNFNSNSFIYFQF